MVVLHGVWQVTRPISKILISNLLTVFRSGAREVRVFIEV